MGPAKKMRKAIIAGTFAQYRDWLNKHHASPRAAPYVRSAQELLGFDSDHDEIVLVGTYRDNPAYQSSVYRLFIQNAGRITQVAV